MNMKLGFVVPIAFLLLQLAASQNATDTDDGTDDGMDDFSGPPRPPPGGPWRHGRPPFGRGGHHCGPPPPFMVNGTETEENSVAKRSVRERREVSEMSNEDAASNGGNRGQGNGHQGGPPPQGGGGRGRPRGAIEKRSVRERQEDLDTDEAGEIYASMIDQDQEGVHMFVISQGGPPKGFADLTSTRNRRETSEMNEEDSANGGGNRGQGNGHQGGPPPRGEGGSGRSRGFVEKRSIRERRELSQVESEGGMEGDTMGQGQGNGRQGGPPQGGGGRGPPRGFVEKRSIRERRDSLPMNGDDMEEMVGGMMDQGVENGNPNDPSYDGGEGPPRSGRVRRCGGRRGRNRSTTTTAAPATTTAAGKR